LDTNSRITDGIVFDMGKDELQLDLAETNARVGLLQKRLAEGKPPATADRMPTVSLDSYKELQKKHDNMETHMKRAICKVVEKRTLVKQLTNHIASLQERLVINNGKGKGQEGTVTESFNANLHANLAKTTAKLIFLLKRHGHYNNDEKIKVDKKEGIVWGADEATYKKLKAELVEAKNRIDDLSKHNVDEATYKKLEAELLEANNHIEELSKNAADKVTYKTLEAELVEANNRIDEFSKHTVDESVEANNRDSELSKAKARIRKLEERLAAMPNGIEGQEELDIMNDDDDESIAENENDPWVIKFNQLCQYRMEHGNCMVTGKRYTSLSTWIKNQRSAYNVVRNGIKGRAKISAERIERLDSIGFYWGKKYSTGPEPSFQENFSELQNFKEVFGHCNVPPSQGSLGRFVSRARADFRRYKKCQGSLLTLDEFKQLKRIGFSFKRPSSGK